MNNLELLSKRMLLTVVIGMLLGINALASIIPWKLDFSLGKVYSLSSSSKKVLSELKKKAEITIYLSSALPPRVVPVKKDVFDLLDEYKAYGGTKIAVTVVVLDKDPKKEQEAQSSGITRLQFSEVESDNYSVKNGYFGAIISYDGKKEVIPTLLNPASLEVDFTSSLYRMSRETVPMIGLISGVTRERTGLFSQVLKKQFDLIDVNTTTVKSYVLDGLIYKDDRKTELTSDDITMLNTFVKTGKTLLVLADGVWVDDSLAVSESKSNINSLLKKYNIVLNKDLVVSNNSETASFRSGFMNYVVKYPFWLKTSVKDMPLIIPWSSSITQRNNKDTSVLMYAPEGSWLVSNMQNVLPTNNVQLPREQFSPLILATESTGAPGKLVVVGNSRLIEDDFNSRTISNIDYVSKLMDGYLSRGILSNIKYRDTSFIQLPETTDSVKQTVRYVNVLAPGLLFALFGFYLATQRKKE